MWKEALLGAAVAAALVPTGEAHAFPDQPIVLNVCQPAGGGNDRNAQALVPFAEKHLGEQLIVQYKPGAGGTLAMQEIKDAEPDGYTLVLCDPGGTIFGPIVQGIDFGPEDVIPIARVTFTPWILTTHASTPYNSVQDLIDAAKANPGDIDAAIADVASADHYAWLRFTQEAGLGPTGFRWIPYGGGAPKVRAMLAGESKLDMLLTFLIQDPVKQGIMRPLAVASTERLPEFPDLPTLQEVGLDVVEGLSISIFAPAGTPADRVEVLRNGFMAIRDDPEFQEIYAKLGQDLSGFISGAEYEDEWETTWSQAGGLLAEATAQ